MFSSPLSAETLKTYQTQCSGILRQALSFSFTDVGVLLSRYISSGRTSLKPNHAVHFVMQVLESFLHAT